MSDIRDDFEKWHKNRMWSIASSYEGDKQELIEKMYEKTDLGYYADREVQISWKTYQEIVGVINFLASQECQIEYEIHGKSVKYRLAWPEKGCRQILRYDTPMQAINAAIENDDVWKYLV